MSHLINGEFQSDKYPTTPRGKVPLSVKDKTAQDLLWEYAQRRRAVDAEFASDLETALNFAGFVPNAKTEDAAKLDELERKVNNGEWQPDGDEQIWLIAGFRKGLKLEVEIDEQRARAERYKHAMCQAMGVIGISLDGHDEPSDRIYRILRKALAAAKAKG